MLLFNIETYETHIFYTNKLKILSPKYKMPIDYFLNKKPFTRLFIFSNYYLYLFFN